MPSPPSGQTDSPWATDDFMKQVSLLPEMKSQGAGGFHSQDPLLRRSPGSASPSRFRRAGASQFAGRMAWRRSISGFWLGFSGFWLEWLASLSLGLLQFVQMNQERRTKTCFLQVNGLLFNSRQCRVSRSTESPQVQWKMGRRS